MLRALLRIMKRNGVIVGLFAVLTFGAAFPGLLGGHQRDLAAAHQHIHTDGDAHVHAVEHEHARGHSTPSDPCDHDCCAPGCLLLVAVAGMASDPVYFESGRFAGRQDRRTNGLTPLTIERPPRG
jgi:hypothetical protein